MPKDHITTNGGDENHPAVDPKQHAGQDPAIAKRLKRNPENKDAQLDAALDETMDASDPPAVTQPGGPRSD